MNGREQMMESLTRALAQPRQPMLVRSLKELAYLQRLVEQGSSKQAREWLEKRARQAVQFWMCQLGVRRGPHADRRKALLYRYGARLRQENPQRYSWSVLARMLDPRSYKDDPNRTRDRIRVGIQALEKRGQQTSK